MAEMWIDNGVEERAAFAMRLEELIWAEVVARTTALGLAPRHSPDAFSPTSPAAKPWHLAHLVVAAEAGETVRHLMDTIAARAGRAGAGYPELGEAAGGITRQAARKRWPESVGTKWYLYTLFWRDGPQAEITMRRSREKAINDSQYAVRQGELTTGGVVAAVVTDAARNVSWSTHFDPTIYDAVEMTLPDDLLAVPASDTPQYTAWLSAWERFIHEVT